MPKQVLFLAVLAAFSFSTRDLAAQEQLRGNEQLRGAAPAVPVQVGSSELTPQQVYQKDGPAVVLIICTNSSGAGELGTGSVIDAAGHVLTNAHVVIDSATGRPYETIHVYFKPAHLTGDPEKDEVNPSTAKVVSWDPPSSLDLALLRLDKPPKGLPVLPIGDSDAMEAGEPVVAIGHPEQGGLWTLTTGVISTVIANLGEVKGKDAFQTDASINRGNSGGPLISRRGAMIGVNTSIARKAADGLAITAVNFSIRSNVVKKWLDGGGAGVAYVGAPAAEATEVAQAQAPAAPAEEAPAAPAADGPVSPTPSPSPAEPAEEPSSPARDVPVSPTPSPAPSPTPKPAEPAPAPSSPASQGPKGQDGWTGKAKIVTRPKPFSIEDAIARDIAEMEDLEKELKHEVDKRRSELNPAPQGEDGR